MENDMQQNMDNQMENDNLSIVRRLSNLWSLHVRR